MLPHLIALALVSAAKTPASGIIALKCSGERVSVVDGKRSRTPWTNALRIDLQHREWCEADCRTQHPVVALKSDYVDLIDETEGGFTTSSHLNRGNGGYTFLLKGRSDGREIEIGILAQCVQDSR